MTPLEHYYRGNIEDLFKNGIITANVYSYFKIYETYSNYLVNYKPTTAAELTSIDCKVSVTTVFRARRVVLSI